MWENILFEKSIFVFKQMVKLKNLSWDKVVIIQSHAVGYKLATLRVRKDLWRHGQYPGFNACLQKLYETFLTYLSILNAACGGVRGLL